jgi:glycosyltransferase involved in cell wall biosynthesis
MLPARVGLICDFVEENWPSMDLVADMVFQHLSREQSRALDVVRICPPLRSRLVRLPLIGQSPVLQNADRLLNRFIDYSRHLKPRAKEFDLFHLIDHSYSQLVHALPSGRTVVTCHDLDTFRCVLEPDRERRPPWFRSMTGRILSGFRQAAHVIAVSAATRDEIVRFGLHPTGRITVISNGVHPSFSPMPDPASDAELGRLLPIDSSERKWLLNVGSAMPRKRLDLLLRVFAEIRKAEVGKVLPEVRLLRVGQPLTAEHRQLARQLGVESAVVELGFLGQKVLAAAYRRADLLVHTAEAEGFGLPLIEAMACGCKVIASDLPVLREVGGTAATYCAVGDIEGWKDAIGAALQARQNPACRESSRERAFANAARFSWSENAERTSRVYRRVLGFATSHDPTSHDREGVFLNAASQPNN